MGMRFIKRTTAVGVVLLFLLNSSPSQAAAGGPIPAVPGAVTNTVSGTNAPATMIPGGIPGGTGTIPVNPMPSVPGVVPTNPVPGGIPGSGIPVAPPINPIPGGVPGIGIPGAPPINPATGVPIGGGPGTRPVSTNMPQPQIKEIVTPEMMQEAIRVFAREAKAIRQEAEDGNARQQHNLAVLYTLGLGVPLDHQTAFKWFNKAANEGLAESQFNVAIALQGGLGTRKDLVTSYKYYILASAQGLINSAGARDHLAQYLNREQIEAGQRMARGFLTALERRRYYERRREREIKRMQSIRNGLDPNAVEPGNSEN